VRLYTVAKDLVHRRDCATRSSPRPTGRERRAGSNPNRGTFSPMTRPTSNVTRVQLREHNRQYQFIPVEINANILRVRTQFRLASRSSDPFPEQRASERSSVRAPLATTLSKRRVVTYSTCDNHELQCVEVCMYLLVLYEY
jgi:hypothetical protein